MGANLIVGRELKKARRAEKRLGGFFFCWAEEERLVILGSFFSFFFHEIPTAAAFSWNVLFYSIHVDREARENSKRRALNFFVSSVLFFFPFFFFHTLLSLLSRFFFFSVVFSCLQKQKSNNERSLVTFFTLLSLSPRFLFPAECTAHAHAKKKETKRGSTSPGGVFFDISIKKSDGGDQSNGSMICVCIRCHHKGSGEGCRCGRSSIQRREKERNALSPSSLDALGQAARRRRRRRRLLGLPRRDARGRLLDRLGRRHEHRVDEVHDGRAGGNVRGRDLGDRARVGLDRDDAGLGEVDGQVGARQPRLDDGAVGQVGRLERGLLDKVLLEDPLEVRRREQLVGGEVVRGEVGRKRVVGRREERRLNGAVGELVGEVGGLDGGEERREGRRGRGDRGDGGVGCVNVLKGGKKWEGGK